MQHSSRWNALHLKVVLSGLVTPLTLPPFPCPSVLECNLCRKIEKCKAENDVEDGMYASFRLQPPALWVGSATGSLHLPGYCKPPSLSTPQVPLYLSFPRQMVCFTLMSPEEQTCKVQTPHTMLSRWCCGTGGPCVLWGSLSCSTSLTHSPDGAGAHRYLCATVYEPIQNIRSTRDTCAHSLGSGAGQCWSVTGQAHVSKMWDQNFIFLNTQPEETAWAKNSLHQVCIDFTWATFKYPRCEVGSSLPLVHRQSCS